MTTRTIKSDITVTVQIVDKKQVPREFYLPHTSHKKFWKRIFKFSFSNGFTYYYVTCKSFVDGSELMTNLAIESELVSDSQNPMELKNKFFKNFKKFISIDDCIKIFYWYKADKKKIKNIVKQFMSN